MTSKSFKFLDGILLSIFLLFTFYFLLFFVSTEAAVAQKAKTSEELIQKYNSGEKIRILIVPGHDDEFYGTEFGGTREVDLNRMVAKDLHSKLLSDTHFEPILAHENNDYAPFLKNYFEKEKKKIEKFRKDHVRLFKRNIRKGNIDANLDNVDHVAANSTVVERLYGINKWSNENNIDLVIHIHFNDYGGRVWGSAGEYSGFAVYVPENQFDNAAPSIAIGNKIHENLAKILFKSNTLVEALYSGIIEDQDLIAIGAFNTLKVPSVLIEYSYIYEPFIHSGLFSRFSREVVNQTYKGLDEFFTQNANGARSITSYTWITNRGENLKADPMEDIYMLQLVLKAEGHYPSPGYDQITCPITGIFGSCTKEALKTFQSKNKIKATGFLGPQTREVLNKKYSK